VCCVSYLAAIHTLNVVEYPTLNYGATIVSQDHYLAGDGPLTAAVLRAFGHDVHLATNQVADDLTGRAVHDRLRQWDVQLLPGPPIPAATRTNTVICDAAGNRTGLFDLDGIENDLVGIDVAAVTAADIVYLDGYEVLGQSQRPSSPRHWTPAAAPLSTSVAPRCRTGCAQRFRPGDLSTSCKPTAPNTT